ncbi:MAG: hypothetical protein ACWGNP_04175, partial [Candidatus Bathyarchaeia archaeon]
EAFYHHTTNLNSDLQSAVKEYENVKCKICQRKTFKKQFCKIHLKAYENIIEKYSCWRKALEFSWREYLSEIERNPLTGEWTKEVASYLINNEETDNVEQS